MAAAATHIRQALAGDPVAFGELVVHYSPLVYSVLLATIRRREPLEDLAQEAFVKAYQARASLRDPTRFGPWLVQITRRTALDWCAAEKIRTDAVEALAQDDWRRPPDSPDDDVHRRHMGETLWQAMDALDEASRQLLLLRHVEQCSYREVARFLGSSTARVFQQTRRAEHALAADMLQVLRARPERAARRLALRASVLGALTLTRPAHAAPLAAPIATGHATWKVMAACLAVSFVVHVGGLLTPVMQPRQQMAQHQVSMGHAVPTASEALRRLTVSAPARDSLALGRHQDAVQIPRVLPEAIPPPIVDTRPPSVLTSLRVVEQGSGAARGAYLPASDSDTTANAGEQRSGLHVALHPVRLRGAGAFSRPGNFLDDLYRFLPTCCGITVEIVDAEGAHGFFDPRLLASPIHFLFQSGGEVSLDLDDDLRLSASEELLLGRYLEQQGLLYFEGDAAFLQSATALLRRIAPEGSHLVSIPQDHPIYTAVYDLTGGFPGEHRRSRSDSLFAARWQLPPTDLQTISFAALWGLERNGRLLAVLSGQPLFRRWQPDGFATKSDSIAPPIKEPLLRAAANIVVYAMHQAP
jgi:RNA polymerase sigma factor (sigma-70 family)